MKIPLIKNTISKQDIQHLIKWLKTNPRLTQGERVKEFEEKYSDWLGIKYSLFCNSGSSANLLMVYALKLSERLKNDKIIVPALSWSTTVSPVIQFGLNPIFCDCNFENFGFDLEHFEMICEKYNPSVCIATHVLGFPNEMQRLLEICKRYDVILLEDSCESQGTSLIYEGKLSKTGTFGLMSTFSMYIGHVSSSIEGGIVCTNDEEMNDILRMIRSHGWARDLMKEKQEKLRKENKIDSFKFLYSFFYPGFNLRATDLQAVLALEQLKKLDGFVSKRHLNLLTYLEFLSDDYKVRLSRFVSKYANFAYPIVSEKRKKIVQNLQKNEVETRPLIAGSILKQPFIMPYLQYLTDCPNADYVDKNGFYLPNNHEMSEDEIKFVCDVVNKSCDK